MPDEKPNTETPYPDPHLIPPPTGLRDRRAKPEGVVNKQSQMYLIVALAVLILLAVMFSKSRVKSVPKPTVVLVWMARQKNIHVRPPIAVTLDAIAQVFRHIAGVVFRVVRGFANIAIDQNGGFLLVAQHDETWESTGSLSDVSRCSRRSSRGWGVVGGDDLRKSEA